MKALSVFQQALLDVTLESYSDIPAEEDIDVSFSPTYLATMRKLSRRNSYRTWAVRILAAAACIALIAAFSIPALLERISRPGSEVTYALTLSAEEIAAAPQEIETPITPSYTAEGYQRANAGDETGRYGISLSFVGPAGEKYMFSQSVLGDYAVEADDSDGTISLIRMVEDRKHQVLEIGAYEVLAVYPEEEDATGPVWYYWTDHAYIYRIYAENGEQFSQVELAKIITSIKPE